MTSISDDLLSVGTEDVRGWFDLGGVNFYSWVISHLQQNDLFFDCKELVEVETVFVGYLRHC